MKTQIMRALAMKNKPLVLLTVISGTVLSSLAVAQDVRMDPNYGSTDLSAGFLPDPQLVEVAIGGELDAGNADSSCYGYISDAPDYRLDYQAAGWGLGIYTSSELDTTILINTPDGEWVCNDDNYNLANLNAGYYFDDPQSGEYNIWVGAYFEEDVFGDAVLAITESPEDNWQIDLSPNFSSNIFSLRVLNNGNEVQTGLATLVTDNMVITNEALVAQGDQWIIENPQNGASLVASITATDETAGLALLTVNGIEGSPINLSYDFPETGRNIALGLAQENRQGVLQSIVETDQGISQIRHTALAGDGEYGAALLNNCGEMIGISQHSSPVLSNRLRPDQDFAFSANLDSIRTFLTSNNVDYYEAFDVCLSEAELLALAEDKIREQEAILIDLFEEQEILEEERLRLQEATEELLAEQEALAAENQARLEELQAREAELEASQEAIAQAEAEQLELQERQEQLEQEAQEREEALAEAARQQEVDARNRMYQWSGFGIVVIALFGFVVMQVRKRRRSQDEAEKNIQQVKQQSQEIEEQLQKASAEFPDIVLLGKDEQGAESRLKINGNALIRSENGQLIGRSAQHADYVLNIETVSRKHLRVMVRDHKIYVEDLQSANGSAINGSVLSPGQQYELNAGDSLKVGLVTYQVNLLEKQE